MKNKPKKYINAGIASAMAIGSVVAVAPLTTEASVKFPDIKETDHYYNAVISLAESHSVTRGQAAKIIAGILKLDTTNVVNPGFKDVPTTNEYYGAIAALANAGIINGYPDGTFGPGKSVKRNHMAKIIAGAFDIEAPVGSTTPFKDLNAEYSGYITALYVAGITTGKTETTFDGAADVTRGQMASFVVRAENATPPTDSSPGGSVTPPVINPTPTPSVTDITAQLVAPVLKMGETTTGNITGITLGNGETVEVTTTSDVITVNGLTVTAQKAGKAVVTVSVKDAKGNVIKKGTVEVTVAARDLITPAAPTVTADDVANTITGLAAGMEYSTDEGKTWTTVDPANLPTFVGNVTVQVRIAAVEGISTASAVTTVEFTTAPISIGQKDYDTFEEAIAAAEDGDTITLNTDYEGAGIFLAEGSKEITIDFGRYTYTVNEAVGSPGSETQAMHLGKGNTVTLLNGTITSNGEGNVKMLVQNYSNLTLGENMVLDGTSLSGTGRYVLSNNSGTVNITENASIIAKAGDIALDSCKFGSYAIPNVTIGTFGKIIGKLEVTGGNLNIQTGAFTDLANAVKYANDGAFIELAENTTGAGIFLAEGSKDIVIDFDRYTYTVNEAVGSPGSETQAMHLGKGNTVTLLNGTITSNGEGNVKMLVQNYSNLTLGENMVLDGTSLSGTGRYVLSNNSGTVNITENASIIAKAGDIALDSCKFGNYDIPTVNVNTSGTIKGKLEVTGGKVNIEGGTFDGELTTGANYEQGDFVIKGGTFTVDPSAYKHEDSVVEKIGENWKVIAPVVISQTLDLGYHFVLENGVIRFLG